MTKADAEVIDTMSIGWIMARICKGGHIELTQNARCRRCLAA